MNKDLLKQEEIIKTERERIYSFIEDLFLTEINDNELLGKLSNIIFDKPL